MTESAQGFFRLRKQMHESRRNEHPPGQHVEDRDPHRARAGTTLVLAQRGHLQFDETTKKRQKREKEIYDLRFNNKNRLDSRETMSLRGSFSLTYQIFGLATVPYLLRLLFSRSHAFQSAFRSFASGKLIVSWRRPQDVVNKLNARITRKANVFTEIVQLRYTGSYVVAISPLFLR